MAAVLARTVRLSALPGSAGRALQVPSQGVSPVIAAPPRVAWPPVASPGSCPARVITCAPAPPSGPSWSGRDDAHGRIRGLRSLGLVDDRDVVLAGPFDAVSGQVDAVRILDRHGPGPARRAQGERLDAVALGGDRVAFAGPGRTRHDRVGVQPLLVVEIHARGRVRGPPVQVIQGPQRRRERIARSRDTAQVVVRFGEPVGQARGDHRGEMALVEPGVRRVRGAPGLGPDCGAVHPFGRQHVADRLPGGGLPRPSPDVEVLGNIRQPAGAPFIGGEPLGPRHATVRIGGPGHRAVGPGVRPRQRCARRRLRDRVGEAVPGGQVRRVRAARHARDVLVDRRVERRPA